MKSSQQKTLSLEEVLAAVGGEGQIIVDLGVSPYTPYRWKTSGIPLKYWEYFMKKSPATERDLYRIYKDARR